MKIIKIESCKECQDMHHGDTPCDIYIKHERLNNIDKDCPLEDYKQCKCDGGKCQ